MTCDECGAGHRNPLCVCGTDDIERAEQFSQFVSLLAETDTIDEDGLRFMPLGNEGKEPAIQGTARLESNEADLLLMDVQEAFTAISHGHPGFAIYFGRPDHGTDGVVAVDRDAPDDFPDDEMPETGLVAMSGSGNDPGHYYYTHDGDVQNAAPEGIGEVRASNYYCVVPGSVHPSGGIYNLSNAGVPSHIEQEDLPEMLHPTTRTSETRDISDVRLSPKDTDSVGRYQNDIGMSLDEVRQKSDKLDRLLSRLNPGGYPSRSEADMAAASLLWFWRFSEQDIVDIMYDYRRYEKTEREDYLEHTVSKACTGDRIDIDNSGDPNASILSILPIKRLDRLSHQERRRYAAKRGIEWPDVHEVRDRLHDSIIDTVRGGKWSVKSAPTGSGKTHAVATERWRAMPEVTDERPVIHAHRTHDARDQARQMSDDAGVDAYTLKGRKELCPVAAGDYDPDNEYGNTPLTIEGAPISEWIDHRCERQGLPFSHAHRWAEDEVDGELPCQQGDTECAALGQFDGIPRDDSGDPAHDVIHCTHQFLHVPSLRMYSHVFIDEKPAFGIDLTPTEVRESVNAYLDYVDAPVDDYSELVAAARTDKDPNAPNAGTIEGVTVHEHNASFRERMDEAFDGHDERVECPECDGEGEIHDGRGDTHDLTAYPEHAGATASTKCPECNGTGSVVENRGNPPLEWYKTTPEAHALAPAFARAVWRAEETAGGRKSARVPFRPPRWGNEQHEETGWNRVFVDVVLNDQWEVVEAESIPDFTLAESVIGLDAHPQAHDPFWMANVNSQMETDYTLTVEERTLYRRYERGLFTVQVGEGVQPVASGEWLDEGQGEKFEAIVKQLREHYGDDFDSAITSMSARKFIENAMKEAGIEEPEMMYYGAEESRNDFAGKKAGLVAGSIDPGDTMVVNLCARMDFDVEPCYKECPVCDGTGNVQTEDDEDEWCETCRGSGEVRERGRTFEGEDAEKADAVLKGVREHHVAQSAGRWARDAEDPDDHATVYIITEAAPTGFIDAYANGVTWTTSEEQRERLEYVRDSARGATAKDVADACGCSKQAAWRTLKTAEEKGLLERTPGVGPYGADVYSPSDAFDPNGAVDLGPDEAETVTEDVIDNYTFTVTVDALPNCAYNTPDEERRDWSHQTTLVMLESLPDRG